MCRDRPIRPVLAAALWLIALPLAAQVVRLPDVVPDDESQPGQLVSHPRPSEGPGHVPPNGRPAEIFQAPDEAAPPEQPELPPGARPGMFQKLIFDGQWLARGGTDGLGYSSMELKTILAVPIPSREYPLIITPGFAVHYFDGPGGPGTDAERWSVPPRVYDAYAQLRWMRRLGERWGIDLAVTQGVFSDFHQSTDDNFRITGHGIAAWTYSPALKFVLGAAYTDRLSAEMLPVCGLIWTPHEEIKYELVFPHPRIARRIYTCGAYAGEVQDWIYLAGEFGGGVWTVERSSGASEEVDYTDFRVVLGLERKGIGGLDARLEAGYVFGREIRYGSGASGLEPADTLMLRGGLTY